MKKILTILAACLLVVQMAGAQAIFKINQYNVLYNKDLMLFFTLFTNYPMSKNFSVAGYFYVNALPKPGSWGEGLAGPMWTPIPGISVGLLGGFQTNEEQLFRFSPLILVNRGRFSLFSSLEFGGLRYRWDCMGFYQFGSFKAGAELIRYFKMYAAGPRVEFSFLKAQPITLFYSALWDWGGKKLASMFGIYSTFGGKKG
jgi:hypothetical protein